MIDKTTYYQFHFMPHFRIKDSFQIGQYIVWTFDSEAIDDQKISNAVEKRLATMRDYNLNELQNITMVSYKDRNNFSVLNNKQINEINIISYLLHFLGLEKVSKIYFDENNNNSQFSNWCTSDNFLVLHQNFNPSGNWIVPMSGEIHTIKDFQDVDKVFFTTPGYINSAYMFEYDCDLYKVITKCFKKRYNPELKKIFIALEWFYQAYKNTTDISINSRIIMLATAFEALLDIKSWNNKKEQFGKKIEELSKTSIDQIIEFIKHADNPKKNKVTGTKKMKWAYRFYELRNKIVHGNKITSNDYIFFGMDHFKIAELFLIHTLKQVLSENKKLDYTNYDRILCRFRPPFVFDNGNIRKTWNSFEMQH